MVISLIPTNLFLIAYVIFVGFDDPFTFTLVAVTVSFIEMMKALIMATAMKMSMYEFGLSLALLIGLSLFVQANDGWGSNYLTVCAYLQLLDVMSGFVGTFMRNRRSNR
jgi:hypothetical protein